MICGVSEHPVQVRSEDRFANRFESAPYTEWLWCTVTGWMLGVVVGVAICSPVALGEEAGSESATNPSVQQFVRRALRTNDENRDGQVTRAEASGLLRKNFANVDADQDGIVTEKELTALAKRMRGRRGTPNRSSSAKPSVPKNVVYETDLAYRDGNPKWKLDLARPKTETTAPRPAIIFIHGGGWASGDKGRGIWRSLPLEYASNGYVCVSVNYRLTDETTVLGCIADCKCAVRWLRARAQEYDVDPDRIGAYGNSAGAHLVAMLGLSGDAALEGEGPFLSESSSVQAVCCAATPSDFANWGDRNGNRRSPESRLFGGQDPVVAARQSSPVTHASEDAPPFLVIHGTSDKTVPIAQGDALHQALTQAGAKDVTYMKIDGAGHGVFMQFAKKTRPAMQAFFDRVLKNASVEP